MIELGLCDVTDCQNEAVLALVGESGDLYLCAEHSSVHQTTEESIVCGCGKDVEEH